MTGGHALIRATALCGTLDLVYALIVSATLSRDPGEVLRRVASGPFGDAALQWGVTGALLGVAVHYAIMAVMAAVGLALLSREPLRDFSGWKTGTLYGLILYCVMYGAVLPLRFGVPFPNPDRITLAIWLVPHIACVGIPLALLAGARFVKRKPAPS